MKRYRKKPVVIEAVQLPEYGEVSFDPELWELVQEQGWQMEGRYMRITTLEDGPNGEAKHIASPGDWIIKGVNGEFYPIKPDIFEKTYEAVDAR